MTHLMNTYARLPLAFVRGEGAWLIDAKGRRILDAISGIGVCSLGHSHPRLAEVIAEQAATLIHTANLAHIPVQEELATRLSHASGLDQAFIANSGAEALECAFKLARRFGHDRGIHDPAILVTQNGFHGRTLAGISASGNPAIQQGFGPPVSGFVHVPFNDLPAAARAMDESDRIVAVLVESIQGEAGVRVPDDDYLPGLRELCDRHDALLMLDEVQSGMCRSGRWFAFQHASGAEPDVITVAKALGNGIPIGACLARSRVGDLMTPGSHGSTFGGNPLACRVAVEVMGIMDDQKLAEAARHRGAEIIRRLRAGLAEVPGVRQIRGRGLMIGIELSTDATELRQAALDRDLLINVTRGNTIRLLPPLIIDRTEAETIADVLIDIIRARATSG